MVVSKTSATCELSHVLTPSINSLCWSTVIATSYSGRYTGSSHLEQDQGCKEDSRTTPVETLQKCSSASSCMQMRIVMEEHYTRCQHSTPLVLNGQHYAGFLVFCNTLLTLWSLVAWIPPSALLYCPRKQLPSAFWQADVCLNLFGLFGKCMCIHCFDCSLVSTFTNETQVSSTVICTIWLWNSSPSLWYGPQKSKLKPFSVSCARMNIYGIHLTQNL
jgi:hypothetical protein